MTRRPQRARYEDEYNTIAMLLDIDHFFGEHQGRLGPVLLFLCIGFAPLLFYIYYGLYTLIPIFIFASLFIIYLIRVAMIILGREKERLKHFRKRLHDIYSLTYNMVRIKTVHEDGGTEFVDGSIKYVIVTYNGSYEDRQVRSKQLKKFLNMSVGNFSYDIHIQNVIESQTLSNRYSKVKLFTDSDAARDFIDIIDHNRSTVHKSSLLTKTIIVIKGRRADWKEISTNIQTAIRSTSAKAFKTVYVVTDRGEIESILSRDIDGLIHLDEMLRKKYRTGNYYGSKVISYDNYDEVQKEAATTKEEQIGFHIKYGS